MAKVQAIRVGAGRRKSKPRPQELREAVRMVMEKNAEMNIHTLFRLIQKTLNWRIHNTYGLGAVLCKSERYYFNSKTQVLIRGW